jgi:Beta propeller domain
MKRLLVVFFSLALTGCAAVSADKTAGTKSPDSNSAAPETAAVPAQKHKISTAAKKTMQAFHSEQELLNYLKELAEKQKREEHRIMAKALAVPALAVPASPSTALSVVEVSAADSITNVQHAGVDEGDIVKVHGNHLVVLRRGRLFTVSIGDGALTPVSLIDAFAPDIDPSGTWYDEMLISGDTIAVIGYSYQRGGTEVGLFHINDAGQLSYQSTYHLRSNDYYSSRNYASRLIGSKLIFYSPLYIYPGMGDPFQGFPAVRKWHKGATPQEFHRIVSYDHVYRPMNPLPISYGTALHTVTVCDLARADFDCKATSVMGPAGRVFYVSPESVYIWMNSWDRAGDKWRNSSMVYRLPLDGSAPSALRVSGSPVDQFSFLESEDGYLNVLVRSDSNGEAMWSSERAAGDVALMRVRLTSFSDGADSVPASAYRALPRPAGYTFQNRFVGEYLLYGTGSGWWMPQKKKQSTLYAVRWARGDVHALVLNHGTDRIEQMGLDAVAVGTDGNDLHFTAIRLGTEPEAADEYVRKGASQGELRSHGFFYKLEGRDTGMLGLPISLPARPGYAHLFQNSAAILFLRNDGLHFSEMGELAAASEGAKNDFCRASCVDWYGNARPIFLRGRYIALLGYEMVEGALDRDGHMQEQHRMSYSPDDVKAAWQLHEKQELQSKK